MKLTQEQMFLIRILEVSMVLIMFTKSWIDRWTDLSKKFEWIILFDMFETHHDQFFESALFQTIGRPLKVRSYQFITGGCINNSLRLETDEGSYFLKWNEDADNDMFEKEVLGLQELRSSEAIRIPEVYGTGSVSGKNYILMEFLDKRVPQSDFWTDFGRSLASMHQNKKTEYGLDHKNYIGRLPQKNDWKDNWIDFFIENRLEVQLGLAIYNMHIDQSFAKKFRILYPQLPGLLSEEPPSLLHGDLWSGNFLTGPDGYAAIMDPAVYYGNREIEIAFTQLFGGYDARFYQSYFEAYPVAPGFDQRAEIYNLYPLLVHVNLFGTSYLSGVERVMRKYC